ncbi:uncharacterized protein LOC130895746 isoform X1 [Diorhabda carinulata]|uniref:uncharacterized protein LOC130895746 isoform X1 n=1 Tax=Diorhabda carinulata TaxID=1163345 RepID=UPI0025A237D5|nr:uncharacterized protein LOC130895746 isoform X1 [Diorhabda carinulata]
MNSDRLKKIEDSIYFANDKKHLNESLKIYIDTVISVTWDLKNLYKEICSSRHFFEPINKYFLSGDKTRILGLLDNTTFFYDIIIEDFARWTIKKEILHLLNNCLCALNPGDVNGISNKIYAGCSKFYIHKLFDVLGIYGDYDFQALILEVIFHTINIKELENLSKELIPEAEQLRKEFLNINIETFDETTREFLNSYNEKCNKIFSICCQNVVLGSIHCCQQEDKLKGLWVDFNMVDGAVSWYVMLESLNIKGCTLNDKKNVWNLITLFKKDVKRVDFKRSTNTVKITIELKRPTLSSYRDYQHILDKELTVHFEIAKSVKTEFLISDVLSKTFGRTTVNNSNQRRSDEIFQMKLSLNRKILRKRRLSSNDPKRVSLHDTSSLSNCLLCLEEKSIPETHLSKEVVVGTQQPQKLRSPIADNSKRSDSIISKDKTFGIPKNRSSLLQQKEIPVGINRKSGDFGSESDIFICSEQENCDKENLGMENQAKRARIDTEEINRNNSKDATESKCSKQKSTETVNKRKKSSLVKDKPKVKKRSTYSKKNYSKTKSKKNFDVKKITSKNYDVDIEDSVIYKSISDFFHIDSKDSFLKRFNTYDAKLMCEGNQTSNLNMSIEKMREVSDNDSVDSALGILKKLPIIPTTPPPLLETNTSTSSPIIRKMKKVPPLSLTPKSDANIDELVEGGNNALSEKIIGIKPRKIVGNDQFYWDISPVWSVTAYRCSQTTILNSSDFLGFYYIIIFYHYDIFEDDTEAEKEIFEINSRLQELYNLKTKILICFVGCKKRFFEKIASHVEYKNLQVPIVADNGRFVSVFLKMDLKNMSAKKSYILVNDSGSVVMKKIYAVKFMINIQGIFNDVNNFQKTAHFKHSTE